MVNDNIRIFLRKENTFKITNSCITHRLYSPLQFGLILGSAAGYGQVAVSCADRVDERLLVLILFHGDMVSELIDAAHLDGLDGDDLVLGGEFLEDVVEETFIVEVLGNLDAQFLFVAVVTEGCAEEDQPYDADDCRREYREGDVAAAAGETDRHREHDREDLTGRTRLGAEAYQ